MPAAVYSIGFIIKAVRGTTGDEQEESGQAYENSGENDGRSLKDIVKCDMIRDA